MTKRTFEIMPRKANAEFPEFQSSIYEPVSGLHNLICEVYIDSEAEYIKRRLNAYDDLLSACQSVLENDRVVAMLDRYAPGILAEVQNAVRP